MNHNCNGLQACNVSSLGSRAFIPRLQSAYDDGHTRFGNFRDWYNGPLDAVGRCAYSIQLHNCQFQPKHDAP